MAKNNGINKSERLKYFFSKKVGKAIFDYKMIEDGDKILVAVSGGKDSLSLLNILQYRLKFSPIKYKLVAVHVDLGYKCIHPKILEGYFKDRGFDYRIVNVNILKNCKSRKEISCFWCSWNRRKALFEAAKELGCSKVALGHHKDDIAETILLNMLFNGEISGMNPKQLLFGGAVTIIRPLAYVEESEIVNFAKHEDFPAHKCVCPNSRNSKRNEMADVIKRLEKFCPQVRTNIFRSVKRIKEDYIL